MKKILILLVAILTICLVGCSKAEKKTIEDELSERDSEVIKEEASGVSQASFFGFKSEIGIVQDMVKNAVVNAKGNEAKKGSLRTDAQLYNYVARGGEKVLTPDEEGDKKWLSQEDAANIPCTKINSKYARDVLGMDLPVRKVNSYKGEDEQLSYFVTPKGNIFCWPPIEYEGKTYVSRDVTIKDENGSEMLAEQTTKESRVTIYFENTDETVMISNEENFEPTIFVSGTIEEIGVWYPEKGSILGIDFGDEVINADIVINNYYFEKSSEELIKDMQEYTKLKDFIYSKKELEKAKNEIFARHGHDFVSEELEEYFSSQNWYEKVEGKQVSVSELNEIEKQNVELLDEYILLTKELEEKGSISRRINSNHTLIVKKDKSFNVKTLSREICFINEQGKRLKLFDINTGNDVFTTTYFDHEFLANDGYLYSTKDMYDGSGNDTIKAKKILDKKIVSYDIEIVNKETSYDNETDYTSSFYDMKITFYYEDGSNYVETFSYEPDSII